jgi:hypothetical protein
MVVRKPAYAVFEDDHAQEHDPEKTRPACDGADTSNSETIALERKRPAAIRPLGVTGKMPVMTERMHVIQTPKTMAGSPDADLIFRSASRRLAHGFCVWSARSFVNS